MTRTKLTHRTTKKNVEHQDITYNKKEYPQNNGHKRQC